MALNVHEQLLKSKPDLVATMVKSDQISGTFMGYMNMFLGFCRKSGRRISAIRIDDLVWNDSSEEFRARVHFDRPATRAPMLTNAPSDLMRYLYGKADYLARAMVVNPEFEKFAEKFVTALSNWAGHRGLKAEDVEIVDPVMTKDYILKFKVKRGALALVGA